MLYCAYTCDYVIFSGFSQASRNFLANFREGARKSLNRAENRGGLGIIRDDSGSIRKVLKTVCLYGHEGSNPPSSAKIQERSRKRVLLYFVKNHIGGFERSEKTTQCYLIDIIFYLCYNQSKNKRNLTEFRSIIMFKKIISLLCTACVLISLSSCGGYWSYSKDMARANDMYKKVLENYWNGDDHILREKYPSSDANPASVWHYTSLLSLSIRISSYDKSNLPSLNEILYGLEYYREDRDDHVVYSVSRGNAASQAVAGENSNVYDDNMWIAEEYFNLYSLTGEEEHLKKCEALVSYCLCGWDNSVNSDTNEEWGGIYWGPYYLSKHTCSNAPIIKTLANLYIVKKDPSYLEWAIKIYDFCYETFRKDDYLYGDLIGTYKENGKTVAHGELDPSVYSYNSGTMISAGALLYQITENEKYLKDAQNTAAAAFSYFLEEKENNLQFLQSTTLWFDLVLCRGYLELYKADGNGKYLDKIQESIDYAYAEYFVDGALPTAWADGWKAEQSEAINERNIMDDAANAEIYALLAEYQLIKAKSSK